MSISLTVTNIWGRSFIEGTLLNAVVAAGDGEWIKVLGLTPMTVDIAGITSATIQVRGSDQPTVPANGDHQRQLGSNITSDQIVTIDAPVKWLKVMVSAWVSGTISAYLIGVNKS